MNQWMTFEQALAVAEGMPGAYAVCFDPLEHQADGGRVVQLVTLKIGDEVIGGCGYALDGKAWKSFRVFKKVVKKREYAPGLVARWLAL